MKAMLTLIEIIIAAIAGASVHEYLVRVPSANPYSERLKLERRANALSAAIAAALFLTMHYWSC